MALGGAQTPIVAPRLTLQRIFRAFVRSCEALYITKTLLNNYIAAIVYQTP